MENRELNVQIADQATVLSALSAQYDRAVSVEEKMEAACQLENHANILRILAERLATQTREAKENEPI